MKKEAPRYLLFLGTILLFFQPLADARQFGDTKYEKLELINPNITFENVMIRDHGLWFIVFHPEGVIKAEPTRFPKEILEELNYDLDKWAEEKRMHEVRYKQRIEGEKKWKQEEAKRIAEEKARLEEKAQEAINLEKEKLNILMERLNTLSEKIKK